MDKGEAIRVAFVVPLFVAAVVSAVLLLLSDSPAQGAPALPTWWGAMPTTEEG